MDDYEVLKRIGELLTEDKAAGRLASLSEYQRRYPGHDDLIAGEYAAARADRPPSSGRINLEWLTAQHHHHYSTLGELARGGMGAIFHIRDETLRRDLAMKVVLGDGGKIDSSSSESQGPLARRFLEEAQITAQLDHPGVVPVHELGADEEGRLFFTMKLVKGRTLGEIFDLSRSGDPKWTRNRVLQVLLRVLETLAFAHDKGVVHRDLKPANVMVGDFGEVYVMDWGLAKVADGDADEPSFETVRTLAEDDARLTAVGQVLGTPAYMPPEQAGGRPIDGRADLYAVGAMLYEFLTGCHPYGGPGGPTSAREILLLLLKEAPEPAEAAAAGTPPELAAITGKAMARDPDGRYPDAMEFAADLRNFVEGRVVAAHASGAWIELRKWIGRNRPLAASIAAAILLLAAGLATTLALNVEARQGRDAAELQAYRAALIAASLAQESGQFTRVHSILRTVPVGRRGWVWSLLDAGPEKPLLSFEGESVAFTADSRLRFVTTRGVEEWDAGSGERRLLFELAESDPALLRLLTPDGSLVLVFPWGAGEEKGLVRVLDAGSGDEVSRFAAQAQYQGPVFGVDRVMWRRAGTVRVRELRARTKEATRPVPNATSYLAISRDGLRLATLGRRPGLHVLDGETLLPVPGFAVPAFHPKTAAFSPDGRRLAVADWEQGGAVNLRPEIHVLDAETGEHLFPQNSRMPGRVILIVCSPDGAHVAVTIKQTVHLVNPEICQIERTFRGLTNQVEFLAFDPSGSAIAATDWSGQGQVWATWDPRVLRGHESFVYAVAFSPDGRRIASGGWDGYARKPGCIRIWDAETGRAVAAWGEPPMMIHSLAFTPDGSRLVSICERDRQRSLAVWDAATGEVVREVADSSYACAVSPDGKTIAAGAALFDRHALEAGGEPMVRCLAEGAFPAFSPDGLRIAASRADHSVTVWDRASLKPLAGLRGHTAGVYTIRFSMDGRRVLTASGDDTVRIFDAVTGAELTVLSGPRSNAYCALFSPVGDQVIAGYEDGRIRIWDVADRVVIAELTGHRDYVYSMALSPDGRTLISGSGDGTVRIWGTRTAAEFREAIEDRTRLVAELSPVVRRLFEELAEPAKVIARLRTELTGRRREVALQLTLAESIRRRK